MISIFKNVLFGLLQIVYEVRRLYARVTDLANVRQY